MNRTAAVKKKNVEPVVRIPGRYMGYINYILMAFFALVLIITPFFRGLYFRENYILVTAVIGAAFVLMLIKLLKEKRPLVQNYLDIAFIGLVAAYFISFIFGISRSNSLDGLIKYIAAFMMYKISFELAGDSRIKTYMPDIIVASGFIIGLFSLLGSGGVVSIKGVFGWGERLNGLYQYPNSTASILGAIFLLNIFLLMNKNDRRIRVAYFISASIMMLTFLETRSRGAMLTMIAAWILSFALSKAKDKLPLIAYTGVSVAIGFTFYSKVYNSFIEQKNFMVLFIAFLAVSAVSGFVLELLVKQLQRIDTKNINRVIIAIIAVVILAVVAALNITTPLELTVEQPHRGYEIYQVKPSTSYKLEFTAGSTNSSDANINVVVNSVDRAKARTSLYNNNFVLSAGAANSLEFSTNENTLFVTVDFTNISPETGLVLEECAIKDGQSGTVVEELKLNYKFIPNDIAKKIDEISLKTESSSERIIFIKDGLKMYKDYILTGTGAAGWSQLYTKYQSYGYISREAHNYYLQTVIESGLLGIISLAALLVCLVIISIKLYIKNTENPYMLIGIIAMLFELFAHAFLDFDFSLFAMLLIVVSCMGWLSSLATQSRILITKGNKGSEIINYSALAVAITFIILSATMHIGISEGIKAASVVKTDFAEAKKHYESAISKDFYNSTYRADYNQILTMEAQKSGDKAVIAEIYDNYKEVERNDPYEARYYLTIMNFYSMFGYFDDASALLERLIEVQPFKPGSYELKANLNYQIMGYLINNKRYKEALKYSDEVLEIEEQHKEAMKRTIAPSELSELTMSIINQAKAMRESLESQSK